MRKPFANMRQRPGNAPGEDTPQCPPEARRRGIEDVLAHWNPGYIPTYGILALREELRREHDDEACGHPRGATARPRNRRLRALFRGAGREVLR